jgi:CRP-like cAMP-binding protein
LDLAEETDLLRKIPMFAKMETSKLKLLAFASEIVSFDDGDVVFNSGDSADFAYVIMEGAVDIVTDYVIMEGAVDIVTETDAGPVVSDTLSQNQLIGELGLLNNAPRNATLVTRGQLRVMKITGDMFFRMLRENADVALDVIRMLSDKLSRSHARVETLQKQVNQQDGA